jgi:hypothetical protein
VERERRGNTEGREDICNVRPVARAGGGRREHGTETAVMRSGAGGITAPTAVKADGKETLEAIYDAHREAWGAEGWKEAAGHRAGTAE